MGENRQKEPKILNNLTWGTMLFSAKLREADSLIIEHMTLPHSIQRAHSYINTDTMTLNTHLTKKHRLKPHSQLLGCYVVGKVL